MATYTLSGVDAGT